ELQEEYKDAISEYENKTKQRNEMLSEEVDLDIHKIDMDMIPEDTISGDYIDKLFSIIKDD
ncbi:MAG: hypothetical protein ACOCZ5_03660, partial [bacterium]